MKEIQHILLHASMTTTDRYIKRIGGTSYILANAFDNFEKTKMAGKVVPFPAMARIPSFAHGFAHMQKDFTSITS